MVPRVTVIDRFHRIHLASFNSNWAYAVSTYMMDGLGHDSLQFKQPFLHLASSLGCGDTVREGHNLSLTALHVSDVQVLSEDQVGYALKALLQVRLDTVIRRYQD